MPDKDPYGDWAASQAYKQRIKDEKRELDARLVRLNEYIAKPEFTKVDLLEQDMMKRQRGYMEAYSHMLQERIDLHEGESK